MRGGTAGPVTVTMIVRRRHAHKVKNGLAPRPIVRLRSSLSGTSPWWDGDRSPRGRAVAEIIELDEDERRLAELGYKQELNRSWSGFSNFAISFSIISILAGCFTSFGLGWNNGGPAAIAWGWPVVSLFILVIGLCMSELVSAFPTSGGIYWWASKLGGPKAGYYTGWLNLIGLLAIDASVAYGCATFFDGDRKSVV